MSTEVQKLLEELSSKGWTLAAIAKELGVDYSTVYRWRRGRHRPDNLNAVTIVLRQMIETSAPKRTYRRRK
jgi:transcriptional regulator with XRE-family HTH domain